VRCRSVRGLASRDTRTPAADPRRLAWRALVAVEGGAFADAELAASLTRVTLEPRDRALATRLVYGTLAWQGYLDHAIRSLGRSPERLDVEVRALLRLALFQLAKLSRVPEFAAVDTAVELAKEFRRGAASGLVNALLRGFLRRGRAVPLPDEAGDPIGRLAVEESHPRWLVERWCAELGRAETAALLAADNEAAPTVLRANRRRIERDALVRQLSTAGIAAEPTRFSPDGVIVQPGRDPSLLPGHAEGLFTLQGEASQLVARLLDLAPATRVLDACAAPGGKATQIGESLDSGLLVAVDRNRAGPQHLSAAARRLGTTRVAALHADATLLPLRESALFDAVLLDAPCSGTGTLRQHPEIRWRRDPDQLPRLAALQERLLAAAAARVRPGGSLVYATCALIARENEGVVERLLAARSDFAIEDAACFLPASARELVDGAGFLRTWPHRGGLDGFFAARLKRSD
jgi:16S rRNA (cytosine967-C5)-methyltransferase